MEHDCCGLYPNHTPEMIPFELAKCNASSSYISLIYTTQTGLRTGSGTGFWREPTSLKSEAASVRNAETAPQTASCPRGGSPLVIVDLSKAQASASVPRAPVEALPGKGSKSSCPPRTSSSATTSGSTGFPVPRGLRRTSSPASATLSCGTHGDQFGNPGKQLLLWRSHRLCCYEQLAAISTLWRKEKWQANESISRRRAGIYKNRLSRRTVQE